MADDPSPHLPEARTEAPASSRTFARIRHASRAVFRDVESLIRVAGPPATVLGLMAGGVFLMHGHCQAEYAKKAEACRAAAWSRDRVERIVRKEGFVLVYIYEPEPRLAEYRIPIGMFDTVEFVTDVPPGSPMRFASTTQLNPSEQCLQTTVFHVRSARDIE